MVYCALGHLRFEQRDQVDKSDALMENLAFLALGSGTPR